MIVALVGLPGSGKSSVARQLGRAWGWPVVDTDQRLESRIGQSIRDFFSQHGEAAFRDLEAEGLTASLAEPGAFVLSTGGGIVLREENRHALKSRSQVFYLRTSVEELVSRLRSDTTRPLLQGVDPRQKLRELMAVRDPLYRSTAHYVVEARRPSVSGMSHWIQMQMELGGHLVCAPAVADGQSAPSTATSANAARHEASPPTLGV
ncbi:MAG: shikimate kinase [Inhella sp.]|uniref:shikimate kinase n=1 Tax=Inhella sp. TaxID=1921806 RepID=UPI003919BFAF